MFSRFLFDYLSRDCRGRAQEDEFRFELEALELGVPVSLNARAEDMLIASETQSVQSVDLRLGKDIGSTPKSMQSLVDREFEFEEPAAPERKRRTSRDSAGPSADMQMMGDVDMVHMCGLWFQYHHGSAHACCVD